MLCRLCGLHRVSLAGLIVTVTDGGPSGLVMYGLDDSAKCKNELARASECT